MKTFLYVSAIVVLAACARKEMYNATTTSSAPSASTATTASSTAEETYPMTATIVSRNPAKNTLNLDNNEVPGKMMAMKMDYEVRGAKVDSLPADGSAVVVTVHDQNGKYWISDVKPETQK